MKQYWKLIATLLAALFFASAGAGVVAAQTETPEEASWFARYWNNMSQEGEPVLERNERVVNYDWGLGSPSSAVNPDRFSAQWTSPVYFEAGTYRFSLTSDDGARVWLDNDYIIDSWEFRPASTDFAIVDLDEGVHQIAIDYFEDGGQAEISFDWQRIGDDSGQDDGDTDITISPLRGPVGTEIDVNASGFTPGSTVTVGIGRAASETTTDFRAEVSADGTLQTSITVPQSAEAGEPWRVLILGEGDERALSTDFIVTTADGQVGDCGSVYIVQPNDWLSKIARNCGTTVDAIVALNPQIEDPNRLSVGQSLNMPAGSDAPVGPRVQVTPRSGQAGTAITAIVSGFEPNTEVSVALRRPNELPISGFPATTNDQGALRTTVNLPADVQAGETWHVLVRSDQQNAESAAFVVTTAGEVTATPRYNLNFRSGPGTDFADLDTVPAGTALQVLEVSPDRNWVRVEYDGRDGWIAAWLSNISGFLDDVPQASDAATAEDDG